MGRLTLSILFLFASAQAYSQYAWEGVVLDSTTKQPLSFVTIIINQNPNHGTRTDLDGKFSLSLPQSIGTITLSYIGYNKKTVRLNSTAKNNTVTIMLSTESAELNDVTILAGENPANRIIRQVLKNADKNNPNKLPSYSYTSYDKFSFAGDVSDKYKLEKKDSSYTREFEFFKKYKLFMLETIVNNQYKFPGRKKETVEGIRISGLKDPSFTVLTSQIQSPHFYNEFFSVMQKSYLSPLCQGSTDKYYFEIKDTIFKGSDTVYVISYRPHKGKNFLGLKGLLYVNTNGYALQEVVASPADTVGILLHFTIQQLYDKVDGIHWFPVQLNTNLSYDNFFRQGLKVTMIGKSFITDIKINPDIPNTAFDGIEEEILPKAGVQPLSYWDGARHDSLTSQEKQTYSYLDSVGKAHKFDAKLRLLASFSNGEINADLFSFILYNLIKVDKFEYLRLGLGFHTNDRLSSYLSVGGFAGYGFHDKVWKYGGNLSFPLYKRNAINLNFVYSKDYAEAGAITFYKESFWGSGLNARDYLVSNYDFVDEKKIVLSGRAIKFMDFEMSAFQRYNQTQFPYYYTADPTADPVVLQNSFHYTGVKFALRYSYNQKVVQALNQNWFISSKYPVIWFTVTKGFNNILGGQFDYLKLEMKISKSLLIKRFGKTSFQVQAGDVVGNLPYSQLFNGKGDYAAFAAYSPNSFQSMRFNEFLSNRYLALFCQQNFGTLLFKAGRFKPIIIFATNAIIGSLNNVNQHYDFTIKTLNNGFIESGLIFDNLFFVRLYGIAKLGAGFGAFYRYGPNSFPNPINNLALKFDWTIEN